jgi:L-ribulose-5-phosphate 3-epimerase
MNRRNFIATSVAGSGIFLNAGSVKPAERMSTSYKDDSFKVSVFSKNLQWLEYRDMAKKAAALGFDGVDLTVRPGGHVLPERVKEDLPKAVEAVEAEGLKVYSIVTSIERSDDPLTLNILEAAKKLNIAYYRMGWYHYEDGVSVAENLKRISEKVRALDEVNAKFGIYGVYQNHEGHYFGAPVWDLASVLKNVNAKWTGSQYDIYHASIEGHHSWIYGFELLAPYIRTINIKDYTWVKKDGRWVTASVPLGEGVVDFTQYLALLKKTGINCPVSLHYEYPLGGADQGAKKITIDGAEVLKAMERDLKFLRGRLSASGLTK